MRVSDQLLSGVVETLPLEVAILDSEGVVIYSNDAWKSFAADNGIVGDPATLGVNYLEITDAADDTYAQRVAAGIRSVLAGETDQFTLEYPCHAPDEERWFLMYATRYSHDGEHYVQMEHLDITERKLAELDVRKKNDRLEAVASILSHDIRNPLNIALGYLDTLASSVDGDTEDFARIRHALQRIDTIVRNALVLARNTSITDVESVELRTAARTAWNTVQAPDATMTVADSLRFSADPKLLSNLFDNLFRNALDHAGDDVSVTVGPLDGQGFYVEDDGAGVPEDQRAAVFERNVTTGTSGNSGLGLLIVDEICDAHGWDVSITDAAGGGARFEVRGVDVVETDTSADDGPVTR